MALAIISKSQQADNYFTDHLKSYIATKEFWDKGLKGVSKGAQIVKCGAQLGENQGVALTADRVSVFSAGVRGVIRLLDVVQSFTVPPKNLTKGQLAGDIIEKATYGTSEILEMVEFFDDVGAIQIGEAKNIIDPISMGFNAVGHTTTLVLDSMTMAEYGSKHDQSHGELQKLQMQKSEFERLHNINVERLAELVNIVDEVVAPYNEIRLKIAKKNAEIELIEFQKTTTALGIAQNVMEIVAVIFKFLLMIVALPLLIMAPIIAIFGLSSASTALARLWMESGNVPKGPEDVMFDPTGALLTNEVTGNVYQVYANVDEMHAQQEHITNIMDIANPSLNSSNASLGHPSNEPPLQNEDTEQSNDLL